MTLRELNRMTRLNLGDGIVLEDLQIRAKWVGVWTAHFTMNGAQYRFDFPVGSVNNDGDGQVPLEKIRKLVAREEQGVGVIA